MSGEDGLGRLPWAAAHDFVDVAIWSELRRLRPLWSRADLGAVKQWMVDNPRKPSWEYDATRAQSESLRERALPDAVLAEVARRVETGNGVFWEGQPLRALAAVWTDLLPPSEAWVDYFDSAMLHVITLRLPHWAKCVQSPVPFRDVMVRLDRDEPCVLSSGQADFRKQWAAFCTGRFTDADYAAASERLAAPGSSTCSVLLRGKSQEMPDHVCPTTMLLSVELLRYGGWNVPINIDGWPFPIGPLARNMYSDQCQHLKRHLRHLRAQMIAGLPGHSDTSEDATLADLLYDVGNNIAPHLYDAAWQIRPYTAGEQLVMAIEKECDAGKVRLLGFCDEEFQFLPPRFELLGVERGVSSMRVLNEVQSRLERWYEKVVRGTPAQKTKGRKRRPTRDMSELRPMYDAAIKSVQLRYGTVSVQTVAAELSSVMGEVLPARTLRDYIDRGYLPQLPD